MSIASGPIVSGVKQCEARFNPYDDNGGSIVAISGDDFSLIACDTRLSTGYSIYSRGVTKLFKLTEKSVLASGGCWCDTLTLVRVLKARMQIYLHEHNKEMSTAAVAQLLSTMLYSKRFFPYYISVILIGLDSNNAGEAYRYDPVGSVEKRPFFAGGSSCPLLQPFLDNQVGLNNLENIESQPMTMDKAMKITKDAFTAAGERDIYTGDRIHIMCVTKDGIIEDFSDLRKD